MRREADLIGRAPGFQLGAVAAGVIVALVLTLAVSAGLAVLVNTAGLTESVAETAVFYAGVVCLAAGAAFGSRRASTRGWMHGAAVGVVYVVLALALSVLVFQGDVSGGELFSRLLLGLACGIVGGVAGVNL